MATILIIWLFVKLWKKAISISDKLPTKVWDILALVSVFLFALSTMALLKPLPLWRNLSSALPSYDKAQRVYELNFYFDAHFLPDLPDWEASAILAHETGVPTNPTQIVAPVPESISKQEPVRDSLFWILLFNAVATGLSTVSTMILAWISHRRLQAELLLKKYEAELKLRELQMKEAEAKVRLREMELKLIQFEKEIEKSKSSPLIIPAN